MPLDHPPGPLIVLAIEPTRGIDPRRFAEALEALAADDPFFHVDRDRETGQIIVGGSNEDHLERAVERLRRDLQGQVNVGRLCVEYKETITKVVEQEGKFIRSGSSRYGRVVLRLEPNVPGQGVLFENAVDANQQIPPQLIAAAEKGIREAAENGVLAGYSMIDIKATLLEATYDADSPEIALKIAAAMACKQGASKASPIILEPVMTVEVVAPAELIRGVGEIVGDLARRRGKVRSVEARAGAQIITAEVPLQQMLGYTSALHSLTDGRATYTMTLLAWLPVIREPDPDGNEPVTLAMRVA